MYAMLHQFFKDNTNGNSFNSNFRFSQIRIFMSKEHPFDIAVKLKDAVLTVLFSDLDQRTH